MVENRGNALTYIGGSGARPIPLATENRRSHTPAKPRPTGLDWSRLGVSQHDAVVQLPATRRCKGCQDDTDLEDLVDGFCPVCADEATARFAPTGTAPHDQPPAPVPVQQIQQPEPHQEVVTVATPDFPQYAVDLAVVMRDSEGHPDPTVRTARKAVANALVALNKALKSTGPIPPRVATVEAAVVPTKKKYHRLTDEERAEMCRLYVEEGLSIRQLAERFGSAQSNVNRTLHLAGVQLRPKGVHR